MQINQTSYFLSIDFCKLYNSNFNLKNLGRADDVGTAALGELVSCGAALYERAASLAQSTELCARLDQTRSWQCAHARCHHQQHQMVRYLNYQYLAVNHKEVGQRSVLDKVNDCRVICWSCARKAVECLPRIQFKFYHIYFTRCNKIYVGNDLYTVILP